MAAISPAGGHEAMVAVRTVQVEREVLLCKKPLISGLLTSVICTEPRGGSNKGSRREEEEVEEKKEEGGLKKRVPQHTLPGGNPAWSLFQHRKLPVVRLERDAQRFINRRQQDRVEKRKSGNRKERLMTAVMDSV